MMAKYIVFLCIALLSTAVLEIEGGYDNDYQEVKGEYGDFPSEWLLAQSSSPSGSSLFSTSLWSSSLSLLQDAGKCISDWWSSLPSFNSLWSSSTTSDYVSDDGWLPIISSSNTDNEFTSRSFSATDIPEVKESTNDRFSINYRFPYPMDASGVEPSLTTTPYWISGRQQPSTVLKYVSIPPGTRVEEEENHRPATTSDHVEHPGQPASSAAEQTRTTSRQSISPPATSQYSSHTTDGAEGASPNNQRQIPIRFGTTKGTTKLTLPSPPNSRLLLSTTDVIELESTTTPELVTTTKAETPKRDSTTKITTTRQSSSPSPISHPISLTTENMVERKSSTTHISRPNPVSTPPSTMIEEISEQTRTATTIRTLQTPYEWSTRRTPSNELVKEYLLIFAIGIIIIVLSLVLLSIAVQRIRNTLKKKWKHSKQDVERSGNTYLYPKHIQVQKSEVGRDFSINPSDHSVIDFRQIKDDKSWESGDLSGK